MGDAPRDNGDPATDADPVQAIEAVLLEEIDLAKPEEDLAFLEFQVPRIALRIAVRLGLRRASS